MNRCTQPAQAIEAFRQRSGGPDRFECDAFQWEDRSFQMLLYFALARRRSTCQPQCGRECERRCQHGRGPQREAMARKKSLRVHDAPQRTLARTLEGSRTTKRTGSVETASLSLQRTTVRENPRATAMLNVCVRLGRCLHCMQTVDVHMGIRFWQTALMKMHQQIFVRRLLDRTNYCSIFMGVVIVSFLEPRLRFVSCLLAA